MTVDYDNYRSYSVDGYPVRHKCKVIGHASVRLDNGCREKISFIRYADDRLGKFLLTSEDYAEYAADANAVNVHWSTKIEGNPLSLETAKRLSEQIIRSRDRKVSADSGYEQELINHLYSCFFRKEFPLPWTLETVCRMHRILMSGTCEKCDPGMIREEEMSVISETGIETFIACPAVHVKSELEDLLRWVSESPYESIVTAVLFFHEFESIHPFTEGNGRCGRSLFRVLMQEFGFEKFGLCKVEDKLLKESTVYYSLLEYTDQTADYTLIVRFFIDCICDAYQETLEEFSSKDVLKDMDGNTRIIVLRSRSEKDWFTLSEATGWVKGLSEQSVRSKLSELVDLGVLEKEGRTRSTRFRFADPFREIKKIAF